MCYFNIIFTEWTNTRSIIFLDFYDFHAVK
jgi:hypothetical protein